jgi:hypothetical protein
MKKNEEFTNWVRNIWFEHRDEVFEWTGRDPDYAMQEYFQRYKYWLKREFKHQRNKDSK